MNREYQPLAAKYLQSGARYHQLGQNAERVRIDSPALAVMTDLQQIPAATIDAEAPVDAANRFMIRRGVRLLLVSDDERRVLGLITSNDILGEKPVQFALERGIKRQEIRVRDIMSPWERLEVLDYADLIHAEVGHIVATLQRTADSLREAPTHEARPHPDWVDSAVAMFRVKQSQLSSPAAQAKPTLDGSTAR